MLTLLDAVSAAGSRAGQNDDAYGAAPGCAWVIDGATDLDAPVTQTASDAAWIAQTMNAWLHGRPNAATAEVASLVRAGSQAMRSAFAKIVDPGALPRWKWPVAALLMVRETADGVEFADLGDCRLFAAGKVFGGHDHGKDQENAAAAAHAADPSGQRYKAPAALDLLRAQRNTLYDTVGVFGIDPHCAEHLRIRQISLDRPTHLLLATDGFSALVDVYGAYDPEALMIRALERGLAPLVAELRAIEAADADGARHPRWKRSDDATAVLLRLS